MLAFQFEMAGLWTEAVDQLPDRILESEKRSQEGGGGAPFDATRDPRTSRPPTLLEAQRLARAHKFDRLSGREEDPEDEPVPGSPEETLKAAK